MNTMELNASLPYFALPGTDGNKYNTKDFADAKATVIIFTCNHCPYARAYVDRIAQLVKDFEKKHIAFLAISSNDATRYPQDSFENMVEMGELLGLNGKYLYDESQEIAEVFGAQRTPEVYIFGKDERLIYHGAIDDNWQDPKAVENDYVRHVLNALLHGEQFNPHETKAVGCTIKWKEKV